VPHQAGEGGRAKNSHSEALGSKRLMDIELVIGSCEDRGLDQLKKGVESLRKAGHRVKARVVFEAGDADELAREATERGADLILAAGQDVTHNGVVNGILTADGARTVEQLPALGIVSLHEVNDLANRLGLPLAIQEGMESAVATPPALIDVASVNGRYFLNVALGGAGVLAAEQAPEKVKRAFGAMAYIILGAHTLAPSSCRARFTDRETVVHEGPFLLFAVGNRRDARIAYENASPKGERARLDFRMVPSMPQEELVRHLPDFRSGAPVSSRNVVEQEVSELTIESSDELSLEADGVAVSGHTFRFQPAVRQLRLAVPQRRLRKMS
jgi:diacylglycerol kinase (ATP)